MYCPNCKEEFSGKFCPECGTKLIDNDTAASNGINLSLGDGNAISGGVSITRNHTIIERSKSADEIIVENENKYMNQCKRSLTDLVITNEEAAKRLEQYGKNELPGGEKKSTLQIFWGQFADVLVLILIGAALISAFLGDMESCIVIAVLFDLPILPSQDIMNFFYHSCLLVRQSKSLDKAVPLQEHPT